MGSVETIRSQLQIWFRSSVFAVLLTVFLLLITAFLNPWILAPASWAILLGTFAPFAIAAMASTPAIVSGGGGIDISIGPLMALIGIVFVKVLLPNGLGAPWFSIPIMLAMGTAVGMFNGIVIAQFRYPPVITTMSVNFVLTGISLAVAPIPIAAIPNWTSQLAHWIGPMPGSLLTIGLPVLIWVGLKKTAFNRTLFAVGADDATAFSAGIDVVRTRIVAYGLGGLFAGIGAIALTALLQSADATQGGQYTLLAIAAVALGGTTLNGGRGTLRGAVFGAAAIFLLQDVLTALDVPSTWLRSAYGAALLAGVIVGARAIMRRSGSSEAHG